MFAPDIGIAHAVIAHFFDCTYTLMNEFDEILGFWFCRSKSILQVNYPPRFVLNMCWYVDIGMLVYFVLGHMQRSSNGRSIGEPKRAYRVGRYVRGELRWRLH